MKKDHRWKCIGEHEFDGDIVITDPCYIGRKMDWEELEEFCEKRGLISQTFYGDWGCTVFKNSGAVGNIPAAAKSIGVFCADAGMVCVMDMRDVLELDPDFQKFIDEHRWCVTVIKGFRGKARLMAKKEKCVLNTKSEGRIAYEDIELRVRGDGEANGEKLSFESVQTSL